jgi:hypothetical protein
MFFQNIEIDFLKNATAIPTNYICTVNVTAKPCSSNRATVHKCFVLRELATVVVLVFLPDFFIPNTLLPIGTIPFLLYERELKRSD